MTSVREQLVMASIDRAGDHAVVLGVVVVIAAVAGLVYLLVVKGRAARSRSDRDSDRAGGPET